MTVQRQTRFKAEEQEQERSVEASCDEFAANKASQTKTLGLLRGERSKKEPGNHERCHSMVASKLMLWSEVDLG